MKSRDWKGIAEMIGITAIVASLIFVGLQMKQSQDIANAERSMLRAAILVEVNNAINEYANIWASGNSGEELNEIESVIFQNLVLSHQTFHQSAYQAARGLGNKNAEQANLVIYSSFLQKNSGARLVWNSNEESYVTAAQLPDPADSTGIWAVRIRSSLARLDQFQD